MMRYTFGLIIFLTIYSQVCGASISRVMEADSFISSDKTKTWSLPATSSTLAKTVTAEQEAPGGSIDGNNTSFTLAHTPSVSLGVVLTVDGTMLQQGSGLDYTISGNTITMGTAPVVGQLIWAAYTY